MKWPQAPNKGPTTLQIHHHHRVYCWLLCHGPVWACRTWWCRCRHFQPVVWVPLHRDTRQETLAFCLESHWSASSHLVDPSPILQHHWRLQWDDLWNRTKLEGCHRIQWWLPSAVWPLAPTQKNNRKMTFTHQNIHTCVHYINCCIEKT